MRRKLTVKPRLLCQLINGFWRNLPHNSTGRLRGGICPIDYVQSTIYWNWSELVSIGDNKFLKTMMSHERHDNANDQQYDCLFSRLIIPTANTSSKLKIHRWVVDSDNKRPMMWKAVHNMTSSHHPQTLLCPFYQSVLVPLSYVG